MRNTAGRKKVLYIITKATNGGAQKYVYDLATNIPKEQFEPIVAYGTHGKLAEDLSTVGIQVLRFPSLGRDLAIVGDIKSFFEMLKIIRKIKPDVLHLNSSKAGGLGALAGRIAGVPKIIFSVHGWPFKEPRNLFWRGIVFTASWLTALLSHRVICVSDYDLRTAQRMPLISGKAVRVYNGINLHALFGSGDMVRNTFPAGVHITGTIGELNKNKNQIALVEQAKNDPDMYVAIVGEGELRTYLDAKIKEYDLSRRVRLFGFIPSNEALKGFDRFSLPSLKEGLPYALLEAKAAGLLIVANRVGGVGEILDANDLREFSLENMVDKTIALYS